MKFEFWGPNGGEAEVKNQYTIQDYASGESQWHPDRGIKLGALLRAAEEQANEPEAEVVTLRQ